MAEVDATALFKTTEPATITIVQANNFSFPDIHKKYRKMKLFLPS